MRAAIRLSAMTGACALVLLGAMSSASAAPAAEGHIKSIANEQGQLKVVFGVTGGDSSSKIDPGSVVLRVGTRELHAVVASAGSGGAEITRTVLLVIDTSGSMKGAGITGAKAAAVTFLAAVPPDVRVGLISFSATAALTVPPTTDRTAVTAGIQRLNAAGTTSLYDAILLSLRTLGPTGVRSMIILSDGADTTSRAAFPAALAAARRSKASIDSVGFRTSGAQNAVLQQFAGATSGHVVAATGAGGLTAAFNQVAADVAKQILITAGIPKDLADQNATISIDARYGETPVTDLAFFHIGQAAKVPGAKAKPIGPKAVTSTVTALASNRAFYAATAAIFLGLLVLLSFVFRSVASKSGNRVRRRLSIYTLSGRAAQETQRETTVLGDSVIAHSAVDLAGRVVRQRDFETDLARRLDAAGVPLKPAEWVLIHVGVAIGLPLLTFLLSSGDVLTVALSLAVGVTAPLLYLTFKQSRRTANFLTQLPDTLQLLAGSLSAGYSLAQALDTVVKEGSEPIASEFRRALVDARLGVPLEDALETVADRMKSKDFAWVIMAVRIQREVGGNLAEVLTTVAATLRERDRIHRQVRALSAEGRLSAAILFALPVLFTIYLLLVRRAYISILFTDPLGLVMIVIMLVQLTVGGFWLRKVVRVDV